MPDPTETPEAILAEAKRVELSLLQAAKPGDTLVVAQLGADGGAVIHTANPTARRLTDLASSLLDAAADLLREAGEDEGSLAEAIGDALTSLPDRFEQAEG